MNAHHPDPTNESQDLLAVVQDLRGRLALRLGQCALAALSCEELDDLDAKLATVERAASSAAAFGEEIPFGGSADNEVPEPLELNGSGGPGEPADEQQNS